MELTATARLGYERLFAQMKIRPEHKAQIEAAAKKIDEHRQSYEAVQQATGVPWYVIGCIHIREADGRFDTYLGNGQLLAHVTTAVPAGRGPFASWTGGSYRRHQAPRPR